MSDSNTSLDFSNLEKLLQDKVHPVEGRQNKNELFKAFLFELIYERRSKGLIEGGESIIRVYDNGLYRKILLPREKYKGKKCKGGVFCTASERGVFMGAIDYVR